jgi:hypothetical protein
MASPSAAPRPCATCSGPVGFAETNSTWTRRPAHRGTAVRSVRGEHLAQRSAARAAEAEVDEAGRRRSRRTRRPPREVERSTISAGDHRAAAASAGRPAAAPGSSRGRRAPDCAAVRAARHVAVAPSPAPPQSLRAARVSASVPITRRPMKPSRHRPPLRPSHPSREPAAFLAGRRPFAAGASFFGAVSERRRRTAIRRRRLLVGIAAVVGDVEAGPLEEQPGAGGQQPLGRRAALGHASSGASLMRWNCSNWCPAAQRIRKSACFTPESLRGNARKPMKLGGFRNAAPRHSAEHAPFGAERIADLAERGERRTASISAGIRLAPSRGGAHAGERRGDRGASRRARTRRAARAAAPRVRRTPAASIAGGGSSA